jgi:hypothetical protein
MHSQTRQPEEPAFSTAYRLSPDVVLEWFGDEALILLADRDVFIRVNRPAGDLLTLMQNAFGGRAFSPRELAELFASHFDLSEDDAAAKSGQLLESWSVHGIVAGMATAGAGRGNAESNPQAGG